MKYAIISDSHDNYYNLAKALEEIKKRGVTVGFHLGDICAPPMLDILAKETSIKWYFVWGNCDGARSLMLLRNKGNENFDFAPESHRELELPEGKIFLAHFPILAENAAASGKYRAAFYGDNHQKKTETLQNKTLLANPGEIAGTKTGQPSFGIWNPDNNSCEIINLSDFRVAK
jgi:putative phosphoesterase